jgi:hypothetical protein
MSELWQRVGSGPLLAAALLGASGLIFAVVGLQMTLGGVAFSSGEYHGIVWLGLATILVLGSVGWASAARAYMRQHGVWSANTDFVIAGGLAALAVIFGFVGLGISLAYDQFSSSSTLNVSAWETFAQVWAFLAFGWLALTRPIDTRTSQLLGGAGTALALLFGVVGLATGLGDTADDFVKGGGWISQGLVFAVIGAGALFGAAPGQGA